MNSPMNGPSLRLPWAVLRSVLQRRRRELLRLTAWSVVEAVPAYLSGRLVAGALDEGFLTGRVQTGLGWLAVLAGAVLVGAVGTQRGLRCLAALVEPFRDELAELTVSGSLRGSLRFDEPTDPTAAARLTHQVEVVRESFASVLTVTQSFVVTTTSAVLGLLALAPLALVLVLPPLLAGLALFAGSLAAMAAAQHRAVLADERIADTVSTVTGGLRDIVACGAEDRVAIETDRVVRAQAGAAVSLARLTAVRSAAIGIGGRLPLLLLLAGTPWLLRNGATTGTIFGALTYVSLGVQPALQILVRGIGGSALWLVVALGRLVEKAGGPEPPELPEPGELPGPREPAARGEPNPDGLGLELTGVTFGYGGHAAPVLRDLNLRVRCGDHIAVVGPSGAGKSTLAAVIAGLLEPRHGRVRLGGTRVLIPQEAYVFAGTVAENIGYLQPDRDTGGWDHAVDVLGAGTMIDALGGYDAEVDPGALSAGQRQLLTLVRAYLSPAPLVILDEATCHLDPAAEARVEQAFDERPGTLVVIAHRISSALRADRVLVLDGDDTLLGNHHELLERSSLYRDLVGRWECAEVRVATHEATAR